MNVNCKHSSRRTPTPVSEVSGAFYTEACHGGHVTMVRQGAGWVGVVIRSGRAIATIAKVPTLQAGVIAGRALAV